MKGWRTVIVGLVVAIGPAVLTYLGGVDWKSLGISPGTAAGIGTLIIVMRTVTTTPVGRSD